jgi:hypothetical protein
MQTHERTNVAMAAVVKRGILIDSVIGAVFAWAHMAAAEVPQPVILRVLADPVRRRPTDLTDSYRHV